MKNHDFCRALLREARTALRSASLAAQRKCEGLNGTRSAGLNRNYYWVYSGEGELLWEGSACCMYEARVDAINNVLDREVTR